MMLDHTKDRAGLLFLFFCGLYGILICNLIVIQIFQHTYYSSLADKQYIQTITAWHPRAPIIDRTGRHYLAINKESIAAFLVPTKLEQPEKIHAFLHTYFPQAVKRLEKNKHKKFMYIKRKLSEQELEIINGCGLPDIKLLVEPNRYYPLPAAGPIVGITNIDNHGLFGLEAMYQHQLAGSPTIFDLEKDARSNRFYFKKETKNEGTVPQPLHVTIDSNLQFLAYEALDKTLQTFHAEQGSVIIMDPDSGDILAMVNIPCFDPNDLSHVDQAATKNCALTECYELGSVIKICAALAALEEGVVSPEEDIDCQNSKTAYVNGRKVNTWRPHGIIPFDQVIAQSNNIGIATVATRIGPKLYDYYQLLGFGKETGLNFPGEQKGYITHPKNWSKHSIISLSYGYEISANLVQLARAFSIIANGGYQVYPRLVITNENINLKAKKERLFHEESIEAIKSILEKTTREGTAKRAAVTGYRVMTKTGTANILDETGHYTPDKNIYTAAGIIEKDAYRRVIITFIKEAGVKNVYASTVAIPLFETIAQKTIIHDKIV